MSITDRQSEYMSGLLKSGLIPRDQMHRWHLVFGSNVMGSYDTYDELCTARDSKFKRIHCAELGPIIFKIEKPESTETKEDDHVQAESND